MTLEERIKKDAANAKAKVAKIKKWPARLTKLLNRKEDPIREAEFCRRHKINASRLNRLKNDKEPIVPSDNFVKKVESAFSSEGV